MAGKYLINRDTFFIRKCGILSNWSALKTIDNSLKHINKLTMMQVLNIKLYHVSNYNYQVRQGEEKQITGAKSKDELSFPKKVAQAGKDVTYIGVIIGGLAVTGFIFYMIGSELFSSQSPSVIFGKALKQCQQNPQVQDELGDNIKGRGEMNRRGRARHVSHVEYEKEGVKYMRMVFHLKGSIREGTANLEVKQNENGKYEVRYLFVEVDKYPYKTIVVEDNR